MNPSNGFIRKLIILCIQCLLVKFTLAQDTQFYINYINVSDGLTQNEVTTIIEDKYGFIWFGTRGGLNRYDGYAIKSFKPEPNQQSSIKNPSIERLMSDSSGVIWIGYKSGGFTSYDPKYESFLHSDSILSNISSRVISFYEDFDGNFWFGGFSGGVDIFDPKTNNTEHAMGSEDIRVVTQTQDSTYWIGTSTGLIKHNKGGNFERVNFNYTSEVITDLIEDKQDSCLWIAGWGMQLTRLDCNTLEYKLFTLPKFRDNDVSSYSLEQDQYGNIFIGTWGEGLYSFNKETEKFTKINIHPEPRSIIKTDYDIVLDIFRDSNENIWLGTDGGGVVCLFPSSGFKTISSISHNNQLHINSIYESEPGVLFLGSRGQGLYSRNDGEQFRQVPIVSSNEQLKILKNQNVNFIDKGPDGKLWIGLGMGVCVLDQRRDNEHILVPAEEYYSNPDLGLPKKVLDVLTRGSELWIATQQRGLYQYIKKDGLYKFEKRYANVGAKGFIDDNRISVLITDNDNRLWAGTYNGLFRYNDSDSNFISVDSLIRDGSGSLCDIIISATFDNEGNMWFGTPCSLNQLKETNEGTYILNEYIKKDGLSDDYVCDIIQDDEGDFWISTITGISKYDISENQFHNFEVHDQFGVNYFSESAGFKNSNGQIYFGCFSGLTYFKPSEISEYSKPPSLVFTNLKVLNSDVKISPDGILPKSINEIEELTLTHKEREVTIEFSSLDYRFPGKNHYAYKLTRGNEKSEIIYIENQRNLSLQNLKPGRYALNIIGTNSNGIWNERGKTIKIIVKPQPWRSWYALSGYIIFITIIGALIIIINLKQERLKAQAELEHMQYQKEKELNEYKLQFFTNISHEFRTPLTLILAPISELMKMDLESISKDISRKVSSIYRNTDRLLKLVNQFLEFRKIQVGKAKLECSQQNIISFLNEIIQPFSDLAKQKEIQFGTHFSIKEARIFFDGMKMSVVFNNLLSNALKYCNKSGKVWIEVSESDNDISVIVGNDGPGILKKDMEHIFDRFNMVSSRRYHDSSGIGLALVKNYVELHQGTISVDSIPDEYTLFRVNLPKGCEHLEAEEIMQIPEQVKVEGSFSPNFERVEKKMSFKHQGTGGAKLLVVEDNLEMQEYISSILSPYYIVNSAFNGKEGFEMALAEYPDLIISDIMMPEMDGFEMCIKIRKHDGIMDTPIILLTAKDAATDKLFGIKKGADAYITKPFDPEFLLEKIKQILQNRTILKKKYSKKITLQPTNKEISSQSEKILNKVMKTIEENISSQELNLDFLARELAMSPTTLYRKMKALNGQSPGEFIKSIRFKRAAQLLRDTDLTISEIIEMVGYQDYKRFRDSFKSLYETTPGEYRINNRA